MFDLYFNYIFSNLSDYANSWIFIHKNLDLIQRSIERADIVFESEFTRSYTELFERDIDYVW